MAIKKHTSFSVVDTKTVQHKKICDVHTTFRNNTVSASMGFDKIFRNKKFLNFEPFIAKVFLVDTIFYG